MIVDENGQFLTQRTHPRMALIETALTSTTLTLSTAGHGSVSIPLLSQSEIPNQKSQIPAPPVLSVTVWRNTVLAEHQGAAAAKWLSTFLGLRCSLVKMGRDFVRPVKPSKTRPGDEVSFADAFPFLLISEASLAELNARLDEPLPMNRFRPNLVVRGCDAFAEDTWKSFRIGALTFRATGPCARCVVTTTNQFTAERGKEPLRTLAMYRRDATDPTNVNFGQNLIHETKTGTLRVGDRGEV